jgi:hypothetical protein
VEHHPVIIKLNDNGSDFQHINQGIWQGCPYQQHSLTLYEWNYYLLEPDLLKWNWSKWWYNNYRTLELKKFPWRCKIMAFKGQISIKKNCNR